MGGSWGEQGDRHDISWFTDDDRDAGVERVRAVVVRRRSREPIEPTSHLTTWPLDGSWSGSVGSGPQQILYSSERAVVAVHGREFTLPTAGQALLVLVDERTPTGETSFETHTVESPSVPRVQRDLAASKEERLTRMRAHFREARGVWHRWLDEQPLIRTFLID